MKIVCMYVDAKKVKHEPKKNVRENIKQIIEGLTKDIDFNLLRFAPYRNYICLGYAVVLTLLPGTVLAAGTSPGGMSLVILMQKASFWVGLGVAIWGVVEMQLNLPDWKSRIFKGILGYVLILILPLVFLELRNNLQADVWNQINGK